MKRSCPIVLNDCTGVDSPITNLSSEAPDPLAFAGYGWSPYNPYKIPKLGVGAQEDVDCSNITWSTVSQAIADLFAQINAQYCTPPNPDPNIPPWPIPPFPDLPPLPPIPPATSTNFTWEPPPASSFPGQDLQQFYNDRQSVSVDCPDGSVFSLAIEAGSVISPAIPVAEGPAWVAYINAYLTAYLLQHIIDLRVCIDPPPAPPITTPGAPPAGGGRKVSGSKIADNPGYICLGGTLNPVLCQYHVSGAGTAEFTFSISAGALPAGVSLVQTDTNTAQLQGTPTTAGSYSFTILATQTGSGGQLVSVADVLNVIGFVSSTLPDGEVGTPYSAQLEAAGGTAPYTFTLVGDLPDGLTMDSAGLITGTPTTADP